MPFSNSKDFWRFGLNTYGYIEDIRKDQKDDGMKEGWPTIVKS